MRSIAGREKRYVEVVSRTDIDGTVTPLWVVWNETQKFKVDRVLDARRAHSLKCGGVGMRYTVQIAGVATYLFWENPRWFVEAKIVEM